MSATAVRFSATGTIQTYCVTTAGTYVIEAAGAQGGASAGPGLEGARVSGMFHLKRGDLVKIVAGSQGTPAAPPHRHCGGGGGSSLVWMGSSDLPQPIKLMLSARGGKGGKAAKADDASEASASRGSDGHGPAADSDGFNANGGEIDQLTVDALATQWTSGTGSATAGAASGKGRVDRGGYNAGAFRTSTPGVQMGDGYVSITPVSVPASSSSTGKRPTRVSAPAANDAKELASAGEPAGAGGSGSASTSIPQALRDDDGSEAPSQTVLPQVTPRVRSWEALLRRRRRP